jgi:mannose/fructose/N-acetylgalactosamine-specific phosphotransferase system component IIC
LEALWVALAGAVVYLDTTAVAQFMICQPIIACPLWGILVGRPEIGLIFGVAFQLIWLGSLPIGAARFPEGNIGALVATSLAARIPASPDGRPVGIVLAICAFIGILTAQVGSSVTPLVRKFLTGYSTRVVDAAKAEMRTRFAMLFVGAIGVHALAGFLLTLAATIAGWWVLRMYFGELAAAGISRAVIAQTDELFSAIWPGLLGAGVAAVVGRFVHRANTVWFLIIVTAAAVVGWKWLSA